MIKFGRFAGKALQWWWSDILAYGEKEYGKTYKKAVDESKFEYETLRGLKYVSQSIELFRRRNFLSWSHHAEVAALEPDEQDFWLERAERGGLPKQALTQSDNRYDGKD